VGAGLDRYRQLTERTDPQDPLVAEEIRKGIRHTYGITDVHDHLPRLRAAARGNVLEIGVRFGSSTAALLAGVEENGGEVWSVDIEDCSHLFAGHPQWTFLQGDSKKVVTFHSDLDLLFVDGDHSYEGVISDLNHFGPRAKVIMCHDANEAENPQVLRAIENYYLSGTCRQQSLTLLPDSHGFAILQ